MDYIEERNERSRENIAKMSKYEIIFLAPFKNGMVWNSSKLLDPKETIFHMVGATKTSIHLVAEGGHIYEKFSVPKNKMKVVRRVKE